MIFGIVEMAELAKRQKESSMKANSKPTLPGPTAKIHIGGKVTCAAIVWTASGAAVKDLRVKSTKQS